MHSHHLRAAAERPREIVLDGARGRGPFVAKLDVDVPLDPPAPDYPPLPDDAPLYPLSLAPSTRGF